jgi:hypothetical protein
MTPYGKLLLDLDETVERQDPVVNATAAVTTTVAAATVTATVAAATATATVTATVTGTVAAAAGVTTTTTLTETEIVIVDVPVTEPATTTTTITAAAVAPAAGAPEAVADSAQPLAPVLAPAPNSSAVPEDLEACAQGSLRIALSFCLVGIHLLQTNAR